MKKTSILIVMCILFGAHLSLSAQTRIAVYVSGVLSENYSTLLGDNLVEAFTESNQYIAVNRSDALNAMLKKAQTVQENGHIDYTQVVSATKQYGESQLCAVNVIAIDNMYVFRASLLDVLTNTVIKTASAETVKSEIGYTKILEISQKLIARLLPDAKKSDSNFNAIKAVSEVELARSKVEENRRYDISYAAFKQDYKNNHLTLSPSSQYYIDKYDKTMDAGHIMWTIPPVVAFAVGMGVGLANIDKDLKLPIILGSIGATMLPSIICYCVAPGYRKKAWKEHRKPYDKAVKDLEKARKYQQRASLQIAPTAGYDWAGIQMRITFD